jgi:hypothetical protein
MRSSAAEDPQLDSASEVQLLEEAGAQQRPDVESEPRTAQMPRDTGSSARPGCNFLSVSLLRGFCSTCQGIQNKAVIAFEMNKPGEVDFLYTTLARSS